MDKKLTIDEKKKYVYEKICFALLKSQLEQCVEYGYDTIEDKVALFNFLVNVNTFVHKNKITGHTYDQDISCIENLLVKCNLHSPEFLSLLVERHNFYFETDVLLEMLVKDKNSYAKNNNMQGHDIMCSAILEHDLISAEDAVFIKWLDSNEDKSTLIAKLLEGMDNFQAIGKFLNALSLKEISNPIDFIISLLDWDIGDTHGSIIPMVESLVDLSEQDKETLIAKLTDKFSLLSTGKVKNEYEELSDNDNDSNKFSGNDDNGSDENDSSDDYCSSDSDESDDSEDETDESDDSEDDSDDTDKKSKGKRPTIKKPKYTGKSNSKRKKNL